MEINDDNNGYKPIIDSDKPVRDSIYDIAKALDHAGPNKQPYGAIVILCYEKDRKESEFLPYSLGDITGEEITRLLISTLYSHECE